MFRQAYGRRWDRARIIIRDIDLEIHATINFVPESQDTIYELQAAIINVFRIYGIKMTERRSSGSRHGYSIKQPLNGPSNSLQ